MKKFLLLLMVLSPVTMVAGGPSNQFAFIGIWGESFDGGGEGAAGNLLNANGSITFNPDPFEYNFSITNAVNQGAQPYNDPQGMFDFVTEYQDGQYIDSFFDIWFEIDFTNYTDIDTGEFLLVGKGHDTEGFGYSMNLKGSGFIVVSDTTGNMGFVQGSGSINCVPAPGALLLGTLGIGLVGAIRRRVA